MPAPDQLNPSDSSATTTSLWTAFKIALVATLTGTERAVRYSDRLAAKGR